MYFDRFDICEAWYIFLSENYDGMMCPLYYRLCTLTRYFKPSPRLNRERLSDNAKVILEQLEAEYSF